MWRFNLRKNVRFHDGTPFTADDVIFSYERARGEGSDIKVHVASIKEIRKVDDFAIDVVTHAPFPILPDTLSPWYVMSRAWCEKNAAQAPVDVRKGKENAETLKAVIKKRILMPSTLQTFEIGVDSFDGIHVLG